MRNFNKYIIALVIFIVLVVIGVIASNSTTLSWKKYSENQYGFEFKYPEDWNIELIQVNDDPVRNRIFISRDGYNIQISYSDGKKDFGGMLIENDEVDNYVFIGKFNDSEILRGKEPTDSEIPSQTYKYMKLVFCRDYPDQADSRFKLMCDFEINGTNTSVSFNYIFKKQAIVNGVNAKLVSIMDEIIKSFSFRNI